jgi:hypothetical protein
MALDVPGLMTRFSG